MTRFAGPAAAAVLATVLWSWVASADPLGDLNGFWSGSGSVVLSGGNTERVKCQVFYKAGEGNTQIRQTIRCASTDYTINALAELRVKGSQVTGSWEEKTYSARGEVTGRYSGESFRALDPGRQLHRGNEHVPVGLQAEHQHHAEGPGRHPDHHHARQVLGA